jgi:hypothetical protein
VTKLKTLFNLLKSTKKLQQSYDDFVRAHVYVNPNLTKAEAKAQFEVRQQRRRAGGIQRYASNQQVLIHTTDATQQIALSPMHVDELNSTELN